MRQLVAIDEINSEKSLKFTFSCLYLFILLNIEFKALGFFVIYLNFYEAKNLFI